MGETPEMFQLELGHSVPFFLSTMRRLDLNYHREGKLKKHGPPVFVLRICGEKIKLIYLMRNKLIPSSHVHSPAVMRLNDLFHAI